MSRDKVFQKCSLRLREPGKHCLKQLPVCQLADATGQRLQRTKGRQFAVLLDEGFNGNVDQISGIIHHQDDFSDGFSCNVADLLAVTVDLQMDADSSVILVQGTRSDIRGHVIFEFHDRPNMADDGPWNSLRCGKVAHLLEHLEQDHQRESLRRAAGGCPDFVVCATTEVGEYR